MRNPKLLKSIPMLFVVWVFTSGQPSQCQADNERPNVLFIAVDDLRPSMGCYGDAVAITPNMDKLATRGVQFNRAYCQVAVCNPSRASLMTGQRPDKLGVWTLPIHFREAKPDAVTIPQWFRKFGYTAVSHGKIFHNPTPDPQSWSEPIRSLPSLPYPWPEGTREKIKAAQAKLPANDWRKNNLRATSTAAPELADNKVLDGARTDMAIEDLRRLAKKDKPFFLAMGYIRPHLAWVAPKKYWDMHDPEKLPVLKDQKPNLNSPKYALHNNSELRHYVDLIDFPNPWDGRSVSEEKARHLVHGYYACVSYVDAQIGRLLDALDKEGLTDNTIVVLWSDHGWKLGEYRGWGKMTNYEIDARVPLIISAPGLNTRNNNGGSKTDQLAELLDLFPTLCDLTGIETPEFVDGESLVPLMKDTHAAVRSSAVSQYYRRSDGSEYMGYSIRTPSHRLVEWREFGTGKVASRELYDHQSGHEETKNIIDSASASLVNEMTELLLKTHPRQGLVMKPKVHAKINRDAPRSKITFSNQRESGITVNTINSAGRRVKKRKLLSGKKVTINGTVGVVFVIESDDGKVYETHSISDSAETIIVK